MAASSRVTAPPNLAPMALITACTTCLHPYTSKIYYTTSYLYYKILHNLHFFCLHFILLVMDTGKQLCRYTQTFYCVFMPLHTCSFTHTPHATRMDHSLSDLHVVWSGNFSGFHYWWQTGENNYKHLSTNFCKSHYNQICIELLAATYTYNMLWFGQPNWIAPARQKCLHSTTN